MEKAFFKNLNLSKMAGIAVIVSNSVFLILFVSLAINNRFATDDYYNSDSIKKNGFIGSMLHMYKHGSGRWASTFITTISTKVCIAWFPALALYNFMCLVLLVGGVIVLAKHFFVAYHRFSRFQYINAGLFFIQFCFFLNPSKGETWFWLNGTHIYLLSVIALMWGTYFLIREQSRFNLPMGSICFLIAGGSAEGTAVSGIFIFALYGLHLYTQGNAAISKIKKMPFIVLLSALLIGFTINFLAPGNVERLHYLEARSYQNGIYLFFNTFLHIALSMSVQLPLVIGFSVLFFIAGMYTSHCIKIKYTRSLLVFAFWSVCLVLPTTYLLTDIAPARVLTIYYFVIGFFIMIIAMQAGWHYRRFKGNALLKLMVLPVFAGLICFQIVNTYYQIGIASAYSNKADATIQHYGITSPVNLVDPGYLYSGNIKKDSYYYPPLLQHKHPGK